MASRQTFTTQEVAKQLGVVYSTFRSLMSRNKITRPYDTVKLANGSDHLQTRYVEHSECGELLWYISDVNRAKKELKALKRSR